MKVCNKSVTTLLERPDPQQMQLILRDLNETSEEKLRHNEKLIQNWISCQEDFPQKIDGGFIRGMLRSQKHIVEKTKRKFEHNLAARHIYKEVYSNMLPYAKDVIQAMDVVNMAAIPKLTPQGYRIFIFGLNRYDPSEFSLRGAVKLFLMMYELILCSDYIASGEIAIFDASNCSTSHFTQFFGPFLKTTINILKDAYAIRLKQLYIVNAPTMMMKMIGIIKPILHSKVRNAIYIHDSVDSVLDEFGSEYLPKNYGGALKSFRQLAAEWYEVIHENSDWFESQKNIGLSGISKKASTVVDSPGQLGIAGSFRKLDID